MAGDDARNAERRNAPTETVDPARSTRQTEVREREGAEAYLAFGAFTEERKRARGRGAASPLPNATEYVKNKPPQNPPKRWMPAAHPSPPRGGRYITATWRYGEENLAAGRAQENAVELKASNRHHTIGTARTSQGCKPTTTRTWNTRGPLCTEIDRRKNPKHRRVLSRSGSRSPPEGESEKRININT
jgi:hypothetical protein